MPVLYFECSIHTSFVLAAEASSLFESSSGEGQAPTLPQAVLQHSFKLRTKADDPEHRQEGEVRMRSCMHMCVYLRSSGSGILGITRSENNSSFYSVISHHSTELRVGYL